MTMVVAGEVTVRAVSFSAILDAPNADSLLRAYAEECFIPGATPQRLIYEALENSGSLHCFAAYFDSALVGFASVLFAIMPHDGKRMATGESIFVNPEYRDTGAAVLLLDAVEEYTRDAGCSPLVWTARVGSSFDKVLSRRSGYTLTHSQHTNWLGAKV